MSVLDSIQSVLNTVDTSGGNITLSLSDTQSEWIVDNMVSFLQNADPNSKLRTNFLTKVIIPCAYKVYLPYCLLGVGALVGSGYFLAKALK
jgi:hypothetical protein